MGAGDGIDKLGADADAISGSPDAAVENVSNAKLTPH
jgi:hypothetical protein